MFEVPTQSRLSQQPCRLLAPARLRQTSQNFQTQARAESRTNTLRKLLASPKVLKAPCCFDALSARLIEQAGFDVSFMSGFCVSAARLASPDAGLISYGEMLDTGRLIHEGTTSMPIIGDGDTGYGNAMNVKRTVRGYAAAGFAGILIEDQEWPKRCGHMGVKRVVPRHEAIARVRAAADARDEGSDILILARTDARQAVSLEEALWRAAAFADAGADILFIDALTSVEDMQAFCRAGGSAAAKPKMANMLEGGRTPLLPAEQLHEMGFKLVAYPLSLLGAYVQSMQQTLQLLHQGGPETFPPSRLPSFETLQAAVGFPEYLKGAENYAKLEQGLATAFSTPADSNQSASTSSASRVSEQSYAANPQSASENFSSSGSVNGSTGAVAEQSNIVEADAILVGSEQSREESRQGPSDGRPRPESTPPARPDDMRWQDPALRRSRVLRFRVTDQVSGAVKLETTFPAGFLENTPAFVPAIAGIDLERLISSAQPDQLGGRALADFTNDGDRVQIFLQ
ncbi:hypothetical protein WJX74_010534 [Apatococcus lobatus]|uniref:Isocitrate lyase n=2 Tax=Apatococcus TaxID=904362 RepID=A0AAW1SVL6_9CHLO